VRSWGAGGGEAFDQFFTDLEMPVMVHVRKGFFMICNWKHWVVFLVAILFLGPLATAASNPPLVIAHRGASAYLPEHTLAAKAAAHMAGADYIEQDVVLSRDGAPVVLHDLYLDAVTDVARVFPDRRRDDGRFHVMDFSWAELRRLSVH
jgi:glycerophosphoryl diester phosphodiesterase